MVIAHSANSLGQAHDLVEHLQCVAELAAGFADKFGARDLAYWAGLWHDLGKFNLAFQEHIKAQTESKPASDYSNRYSVTAF